MTEICTDFLLQRERNMGYDHVTFSKSSPSQECPLLPRQRRRMSSIQAPSYGVRRFCFPSGFLKTTDFLESPSVSFPSQQQLCLTNAVERNDQAANGRYLNKHTTGSCRGSNQQARAGKTSLNTKSSASFSGFIRQ